MKNHIKPTQLTRVGYTYQDLVCIQILIEWFHDPEMYQWVSIEGSQDEGKLKSLDDVVVFTNEGKYRLTQVKFTTDSDRDGLQLSFDWLLKSKKKGTSLVQKWAEDVKKYSDDGLLSYACLKTNRKPDDEIKKCLSKNNKIDVAQIPPEQLKKIEAQLSTKERVKEFFEAFTFEHSLQEIDDLENQLQGSVVPDHTTTEGWLRFLKAVERWATRKNEPKPDGKIKIETIREQFKAGISRELSQFYEVPEGYEPPTLDFHSKILEKIKLPGCWVISGHPGLGKSTYLSFLTNYLVEEKAPVVRHHYYLASLSHVDRISYPHVARSLQSQLKRIFPTLFVGRELDPEELVEWLDLASQETCKSDKQLTVIIDGLDHVSRERSDITQLEHLVNKLLSLSDKICLIFGTQPVGQKYLPSKLQSNVLKETNWIDLPYMDLNATKSWLEALYEDEEIELRGDDSQVAREIVEISEALLKVSGGYPLHLIFSIKKLTLKDKRVSAYEVEKLPACPEGDIYAYYRKLWGTLSVAAKEILLLVACVDFSWPNKESIGSCFKDSLAFTEAFDEINHLIEEKRSGVYPFHGSLIVFLTNLEEYKKSEAAQLKKVEVWLKESAPDYWRWGWQWVVSARLGDVAPLIEGITRSWLIKSYCKGYPLQHIEQIMSVAERFALESSRYADLVSLRLLKIRLINGPEFQIQEYDAFLQCALSLQADSHSQLWAADNLRTLADNELVVVSSLFRGVDETVSDEVFDEIIRRLQFYAKIEDKSQKDKISSLIESALDVLTDVSDPNIEKILWFLDRLNKKSLHFNETLDRLISTNNGNCIFDIPARCIPEGSEGEYGKKFVIACCLENVSINDRPEKNLLAQNVLGAVSLLLQNEKIKFEKENASESWKEYGKDISSYFYDIFFSYLVDQLINAEKLDCPAVVNVDEINDFIPNAADCLKYAAYQVAQNLNDNDKADALSIFEHIKECNIPEYSGYEFEVRDVRNQFLRALIDISIDFSLLLKQANRLIPATTSDLEARNGNAWWDVYFWVRRASEKNVNLIPEDIAENVVKSELSRIKSEKNNTSNLANDFLELTQLSIKVKLQTLAEESLELCAKNTLGYGWRKDITCHDVYEVIQECSDHNVGDVEGWLKRIAPFTSDIFEFTEREIRHLPGWFLKLVAKHCPERLVDEFRFNLKDHNWWIAEDVICRYIEHCDFSMEASQGFSRCITSYETLEELKKRSEADVSLITLYQEQYEFLGGLPQKAKDYSSSNVEKDKNIEINFDRFQPEQIIDLENFLEREKIYVEADNLIEKWVAYWDRKGKGLEIIKTYEKIFEDNPEFPFRLRRSLDTIFSLSHKLQGARTAYKWAVQSIRQNSHWGRWNGQFSTERIIQYGKIYADEWEKLLADTTKGEFIKIRGNEWVVVPTDHLVVYLFAVGQSDLAVEITERMVSSLEAEIEHLPISPLHWRETPVKNDEISNHMLLLYYLMWPDRLAKRRAASEIAKMLDDVKFRKLYLEYLADLNYEMQIVDLLSVLRLTQSQIFSFGELSPAIKYPSLLSDAVLGLLGYEVDPVGQVPNYYSAIDVEGGVPSDQYEKAKDGLSPIYFNLIAELGRRLGYPLSEHMVAEWNEISQRESFYYFNPYSFCGDLFYRQDRISCGLSSHAESTVLSAYLRALAFAYHTLDFPHEEAVGVAMQAFPFGGFFSGISHAKKPENWPNFEPIEEGQPLPGEDELVEALGGLVKGEDITLRASGPVLRDLRGVCCDLEVRAFNVLDGVQIDAKEIFEKMDTGSKGLPEGVYSITRIDYPSDVGRWETDLLIRGHFTPSFVIGYPFTSVSHSEKAIEFYSGDVLNASWQSWVSFWCPAFYRGLNPSIGTQLKSSREIADFLKENSDGGVYLLGKLTILDKRSYNSSAAIEEVFSYVKI